MKRLLVAILALISFAPSFAERANGIEYAKKGQFTLGLGIGVPGYTGPDVKAVMPMVTLDCAWGIADGFIKSKHFGANGAIDLGFQYGICGYNKWKSRNEYGQEFRGGVLQNMVLLRSAFHYQFVKQLDTYAGFCGGVDIPTPTGDWDQVTKDRWDHAHAAFGMYTGAKWYFTDSFGVMLEFEGDFINERYPSVSAGVSFKF